MVCFKFEKYVIRIQPIKMRAKNEWGESFQYLDTFMAFSENINFRDVLATNHYFLD